MIRLVVGEDSVLFREGLVRVLADRGFEVCAQAGDEEDVLRRARAFRPDVLVLDVRMPPTHTDEGLRIAESLADSHPGIGILLLSQYVETQATIRLLQRRSTGVGYLLKDRVSDLEAFDRAIRTVASGGTIVDPEVAARMVGRRRDPDPLADLTARELDVLRLMAEGRTNAAIAEAIAVGLRTVEFHIAAIFRKLGLPDSGDDHRRVLAVVTYLRH